MSSALSNDIPRIADCLVIGAGPAGLTAAIYLARFHLDTVVLDGGDSRAALIPVSHNHAGYPHGISGVALLERMREQATEYGAQIIAARADRLERDGDGFLVTAGAQSWRAHSVLVATGVVNNRPAMPDALHDAALASGRLRYCPVCDGFEVTDARVGVIGTGGRGLREALFLRSFTADVTLIAPGDTHDLSDDERRQLADAGIDVIAAGPPEFALAGDSIIAAGRSFDSIYPALGSVVRSDLAAAIGADTSEVGCLIVDSHQRTSVSGLFAAGDVVIGLDQISHAMGEGGVAATTMRNDLAKRRSLFRIATEPVKAAAE